MRGLLFEVVARLHRADVLLVATPICRGAASRLYFKMVGRMNGILNQATLGSRHPLRIWRVSPAAEAR